MNRKKLHRILDLCLDVQKYCEFVYADVCLGNKNIYSDSVWVHEVFSRPVNYIPHEDAAKSLAEKEKGKNIVYLYDPGFKEAEKHLRRLLNGYRKNACDHRSA